MTLNINDDQISSNHTAHTAHHLPGAQDLWEVSWLSGQSMDRSHALAAMALADAVRDDEKVGHVLSPDIIDQASVFFFFAGKSGEPSDPEAGG
jgi:hypothetical protein